MKLEYLCSQLANLDQILYEASLGWGKGCIRFWDILDQNSGFHGNRKHPPFLCCFLSDLSKLAGNKGRHKISDEFEFWPDWIRLELHALEGDLNFQLTYYGISKFS